MMEPARTELEVQEPMTVIAALRESPDSILIASDTAITETGAGITDRGVQKLFRHEKPGLVWGTGGDVTVGFEQFGRWMQDCDWPTESWETFGEAARAELSQLNAAQRARIREAGGRVRREDTAEALIVAFVDGTGHLLELTSRGTANPYDKFGFHAIGTGKLHAYTAKRVAEVMMSNIKIDGASPELGALGQLHAIVMVAAGLAPGCGRPVDLWRVTSEHVEIIVDKDKTLATPPSVDMLVVPHESDAEPKPWPAT